MSNSPEAPPKNPAAAPAAFSPDQMAQLQAMIQQATAAGFAAGAASVPQLPDDQVKAQQRIAAQREAAKKPHPVEYGNLRHGQHLRDGTIIKGRQLIKDGEDVFLETPVEYVCEPDGKRIVSGKAGGVDLAGKFM